jgi:ferredoxin
MAVSQVNLRYATGVKMTSKVDPDLCISCELCTNICPDVYSMGDDGFAHAIEGDIPQEHLSEAENARDSCPTSAIDLD